MAREKNAVVAGVPVSCPVCSGDVFRSKSYMVANSWLQVFDLEGFGSEGIMLICARCTSIQHLADAKSVELRDAGA